MKQGAKKGKYRFVITKNGNRKLYIYNNSTLNDKIEIKL